MYEFDSIQLGKKSKFYKKYLKQIWYLNGV